MALFHLHRDSQVLVTSAGDVVPLRPQSFRALDILFRHQDRIVSRERLFDQLWPARVVSDDSLSQCMADVRRALGPRCRSLLRTYPKRGYQLSAADPDTGEVLIRLVADVKEISPKARTLDAPVGRDVESRLLDELWQRSRRGDAQWVVLSGPAGIGKTCLARHLMRSVAEEPCSVLVLQCSPQHTADAFWPVVQHLCGEEEGATRRPHDVRRDRLRAQLASVDDAAEASLLDGVVNLLLPDAAGAAVSSDERQDAKQVRIHARSLLSRHYLREASRRPLILLVEDLHWIDPSTADWLAQFMRDAWHRPVLLLTTSRAPDSPAFEKMDRVTVLRLNRLCADDARRLTRRTCADALGTSAIEHVVDATAGNPLFIREWTRAVQHAKGPVRTAAPSLLDALLSRVGRDTPARHTVQRAACIGLRFQRAGLARISKLDAASLDRALELLVRAELLGLSEAGDDRRFHFRHDLLRQAAHDSMDPDARKQCHSELYASLATCNPADDELLAHHAQEAGQARVALKHLNRAGERALKRSAFREAILCFDRAIDVLASQPVSEPALRIVLLVRSAHASIGAYGFAHPQTASRFERAHALLAAESDSPERYPVAYGRWAAVFFAGHYAEALERAVEIERDALGGSAEERFLAHRLLGINRYMLGQLVRAERHFDSATTLFEPARRAVLNARYGTDLELSMRLSWAMTSLLRGDADRAFALVPSVDQLLASKEMDTNTLGFALSRSILFQHLAESDAVDDTARVALDFAERYGLDLAQGVALGVRASVEFGRGRPAHALPLIRSACRVLERSGTCLYRGYFRALEYAVLSAERDPNAPAARERLFDETEEWMTSWLAPECRRLLALSDHGDRADPSALFAALRDALEIARRQDASLFALRIAETLGATLLDAGRSQEVLTLLRAERTCFPRGGRSLPVWQRTRQLLVAARTAAFAEAR